MRPVRLVLAAALLLGALPLEALAGGTTASQSLRLARGARAAGLADAYSALAEGSAAMAWNPAGMNSVRALEAAASHLSYLDGIAVDTLQVVLPIYGLGAWGLGLDYLYAGDQGYDNWGEPTGEFGVFDFTWSLGFSLELPRDMHLGAVYKALRQGYGGQMSMGSGFDLGWQWKGLFGQRLDLAAVGANLGTPMALGQNFSPLPITWKLGAALRPLEAWTLSADFDHQPVDHVNKWHLGSEVRRRAGDYRLAARGGYTLGPQQELGGLTGLAVGAGLGLRQWQLDYAWQPLGDLGSTHRVSVTYQSWVRR